MRMTRKQLQIMIDDARHRYVEMPGETRLKGEAGSLSEGERIGLCYLMASMGVAQRMGIDYPELDTADSEPETEL